MLNYTIRKIQWNELHILEVFLYESIFQRDEGKLLPREVINEPQLRIYIEDFGRSDDLGLVAEVDGKIVGAVWTRILSGQVKGYGNIDEHTPEFAISLLKEYRHQGLGTALMTTMLQHLKERGYSRTSLSVQKDNYAVKMYKKAGFEIVEELTEDYLMVCKLN